MQGPNYTYNNNFMKDINQSLQGGSNKQGKKSNYKYYKGEGNKNNQNNNIDEKVNMNLGENNQNYPYYRNRQNRKNFQENNSNINPPYKKKKQKKRDNNNNDFQFQSNNTTELSHSSKEDYLEQQQQNNTSISSSNSHQNIYNKQYKKNQMIYNNTNMNSNEFNNSMSNLNINNTIGNFNSNMNNSNINNNNLNNPNLTPQRRNQITKPFGFNQNLSNNKNMNNQTNFNLNNLNQGGKNSIINPMITQQNQNHPPSQNQIYINPNNNLLLMGALRQSLSMNDNNDQEISLNDEKSSENLSEDIVPTRGGNPSESSLQINKNNNDFINPEMIINNRYFQPNFLTIPYNMNVNSINNSLGNINNINNLNNINYNNINNIQNVSNYNQNMTNQINNINNINNLNNLSMGNFQMPIYDQQNNPLYNSVLASNMKNNYSLSMNNDEINHKKAKKIPNKSPKEQSFTMNAAMSMGNMLPNLNYNGPNLNNNLSGNNKNISLSSQAPKNTVPNFNQVDNLNFPFNQNKINQQGLSPLLNMNMNMNNFGNKNYFIPQNMKNAHKNNNIWNNLNNSNINNNNGNINDNFNGSKSNIFNKKDFHHRNNINNNNYNNNYNNNKKFNKLYNYNAHQPSNPNNSSHIINNGNKNNKLKQNNGIDDNNNLINNNIFKNNNNNYNNNGQNPNGNMLRSNKSQKQYLLSLCLKFGNKDKEILNFKTLKDTNGILQKVKEKRNLNDKIVKLIQMKINKAVQIIKQVYDLNLNKYTYKNLANINYQMTNINHGKERERKDIKIYRSKSSKAINKLYGDEMKIRINDIKQVEMLNISY